MQAAAHKVQETAGRVVHGLEEKVGHVGQSARHAIETGRHAIKTGRDAIQSGRRAIQTGRRAIHTGRDRVKAMEHGFEDRIRAKPLKSLAVALAIGTIAGLMLRRR